MGNNSDSTTPLITVITSTYNWSSVLHYAIQSVVWQTFQEWEMWVIGDACTDDSAEVVASFNDPRLHWHNRTENAGNQSLPNNDGLTRARGKYVAYLGHDDVWYPTHLEHLVQAIEQADADLAYAIAEWIGAPGSSVRCVSGVKVEGQAQWRVTPSSILHRRDVVDHVGPWKDYRTIYQPPDVEFFGRVWEYRQRFINTNRLTVFKFPSGWRVDSYRERRSDEQAAYAKRIQTEPEFLSNELQEIVEAFVNGKAAFPNLVGPLSAGPGWKIDYFRKVRGLEPNAELPRSRLQSTLRPIRVLLRRILGKLMQVVGNP